MTAAAALQARDLARRRAMIDADGAALHELLADDLSWTHSSGNTESKAEFIAAITSHAVDYQSLDVEQDQMRIDSACAVHHGTLRGRASRNGQEKALNARFLAVWRLQDAQWRLAAWQSTHCSD